MKAMRERRLARRAVGKMNERVQLWCVCHTRCGTELDPALLCLYSIPQA